MSDPIEHSHSDSAFELLREFQVGVIGAEEAITNPDFVYTEHFKPEDTEAVDDYNRNRFLDLNRPLIMQVWNSDFSKNFYLQQFVLSALSYVRWDGCTRSNFSLPGNRVHQPRHLPHSARLFGPSYLEVFTVTPWYMVPILWLPIALSLLVRSVLQQKNAGVPLNDALITSGACFLLGNFIWTVSSLLFHAS